MQELFTEPESESEEEDNENTSLGLFEPDNIRKIQGRLNYLEEEDVLSGDEASDILGNWMFDNDLEFNDDCEVVKKDNSKDEDE